MTLKKFYFLAGALIAAFLFYHYASPALIGGLGKNTATLYDASFKTEAGHAIKVVRVIDGDTVELVNGDRLRYIGIDTPEEVDPRKPVQCFAKEAAAANQALVEGQSIIFYKDVSDRDKYGRWLGFVYLSDGTFVNLALVKQGLAFSYPYEPDTSRVKDFNEAETEARGNGLGLWAACRVYRTSTGREQTNTL
ncbi:MAG: thermonuclease family protein [Candidatus Liptonbacteria bacterium]|nr:thermonuclease family protein [Candidatus Liptonbacteria bacterium]